MFISITGDDRSESWERNNGSTAHSIDGLGKAISSLGQWGLTDDYI